MGDAAAGMWVGSGLGDVSVSLSVFPSSLALLSELQGKIDALESETGNMKVSEENDVCRQ